MNNKPLYSLGCKWAESEKRVSEGRWGRGCFIGVGEVMENYSKRWLSVVSRGGGHKVQGGEIIRLIVQKRNVTRSIDQLR